MLAEWPARFTGHQRNGRRQSILRTLADCYLPVANFTGRIYT